MINFKLKPKKVIKFKNNKTIKLKYNLHSECYSYDQILNLDELFDGQKENYESTLRNIYIADGITQVVVYLNKEDYVSLLGMKYYGKVLLIKVKNHAFSRWDEVVLISELADSLYLN